MDTIQASADPSAALPRAKRSLPRTSPAYVFHWLLPRCMLCKSCFREYWRRKESHLSKERKQCFAAACAGMSSIWATCATWALACKHVGPSAALPRTFYKPSAKSAAGWSSWLVVGNCSSSNRCVLYAATPFCFYCNCFSVPFHVRKLKQFHIRHKASTNLPRKNPFREAFRMLPRAWRGAHVQ